MTRWHVVLLGLMMTTVVVMLAPKRISIIARSEILVSAKEEEVLNLTLPPTPKRSTPVSTHPTSAPPQPTPAPPPYEEPCNAMYSIERHDHESSHGDVCRSSSGAHICPKGCASTGGSPPYCAKGRDDRATPCRSPRPAGDTPYRCDQGEGERGVCIKAEGHPHFKGAGMYSNEDCDGKCGTSSSGCTSDWECSLAGVCDASSGECKCDAWAAGSDCSYLNFKPVDKLKLGYMDTTHTSWGGNVLQAGGKWHLYVAEIACRSKTDTRCGLNSWKTQSQVAHAVSSHPAGPYIRQSLVLPTEHHNPTVQISPADNSWNLYSIGDWDGPIVVSTSTDEGKTWSAGNKVMAHNNPGPVLNKDGSLNMFYRFEGDLDSPTCSGEAIGVQHCKSRTGECGNARGVGGEKQAEPIFKHTGEDPSVFIDSRGNYHMLLNALPWACVPKDNQGGHAWSRDGTTWSEPRVGAYNTTVQFTDGTIIKCERRERPQMIFDAGNPGQPLALVTALLNCPPFGNKLYKSGADSFTLVQEMEA